MSRLKICIALMIALMLVSACSSKKDADSNGATGGSEALVERTVAPEDAPPPPPAEGLIEEHVNTPVPLDNTATKLEPTTLDINGASVEIPNFVYDHDNPQLERTNGVNHALSGLNLIAKKEMDKIYKDSNSIVNSYTFNNKPYLQYVVTVNPGPGVAGELFSSNYNVDVSKAVLLEEFLPQYDLDEDAIAQKVKEASTEDLQDIQCAGFLWGQGDGTQTALLLEASAAGEKAFFQYILETSELSKLDPDALF
jgi:hypothetical protein